MTLYPVEVRADYLKDPYRPHSWYRIQGYLCEDDDDEALTTVLRCSSSLWQFTGPGECLRHDRNSYRASLEPLVNILRDIYLWNITNVSHCKCGRRSRNRWKVGVGYTNLWWSSTGVSFLPLIHPLSAKHHNYRGIARQEEYRKLNAWCRRT